MELMSQLFSWLRGWVFPGETASLAQLGPSIFSRRLGMTRASVLTGGRGLRSPPSFLYKQVPGEIR